MSCLKTASVAPCPYQFVQAGRVGRRGGPLLWAVRPEASVEHVRNTTRRPRHSCGFGLTAALKNLQLQKTREPGCHGFKRLWVQKAERTCCFVKVIEIIHPALPGWLRSLSVRSAHAERWFNRELQPALFMMTVRFLWASGRIPHIIKP